MKKQPKTNRAGANAPATNGARAHFHFENPQARQVYIASTFNDWHPAVTEMISLGGGRWAKDIVLPPGRYEYRLVVDGEWFTDPANGQTVTNPFGGLNSVLTVAAPG
jgi:1,4-alpha-glucan branching enzyme